VLARHAQYSARTGRDSEAVTAMKRALRLDPLNPLIYRAAGSVEYAARRYAESIPPLRKALEMNPKMGRAHASIGDALLMLGKTAEAQVEYAAEPALDFNLAGIAIAGHRLGDAAAAGAALDRLRRNSAPRRCTSRPRYSRRSAIGNPPSPRSSRRASSATEADLRSQRPDAGPAAQRPAVCPPVAGYGVRRGHCVSRVTQISGAGRADRRVDRPGQIVR